MVNRTIQKVLFSCIILIHFKSTDLGFLDCILLMPTSIAYYNKLLIFYAIHSNKTLKYNPMTSFAF